MKYFIYILLGWFLLLQSCSKYLDVKPRSNLVIPETLDDMEQLLDNANIFTPYPELLELQADDFYFEEDYWHNMANEVDRNAYIWEKDVFGTTESHSSWSSNYTKVLYTNAVLDGLENIERTAQNHLRHDQIKGSALFLKAEAVYVLLQLYAKVYDIRTATEDLGIPIPVSADVNETVYRPSVHYTFEFIINSLWEAERLLSPVPDFSRPSKPAAQALLARVYLYMGDYDRALKYSNDALAMFDTLSDFNVEIVRDYKNTLLMRMISPAYHIMNNIASSTIIDTDLVASYAIGDLRKNALFRKNPDGKAIKNGINNLSVFCFSGLDSDELFLIRAECHARGGQVEKALKDLNHLLEHRFTENDYTPYDSQNRDEVLNWVLKERRKELVFRGVRWSDLKRLNRDGYNFGLTRKIGDEMYALPSGDSRWVLPIPVAEINISGIDQNVR